MKKILNKTKIADFATYIGVVIAFIVMNALMNEGLLTRSMKGQLVPICCYIVMAVSLNLTVGILGELSLGHAGFMSVGAFTGVVTAMSLQSAIPSDGVRLALAIVMGAIFAGIAGTLVGIPVLRLHGDYLAIVTLAFGEIIKELINCLIIGHDENGLHIIFNATGAKTVTDLGLTETGKVLIKGAQGATGTDIAGCFDANGNGAIVNASRSILCAWKKREGMAFDEAARAEALRMREDLCTCLAAVGKPIK